MGEVRAIYAVSAGLILVVTLLLVMWLRQSLVRPILRMARDFSEERAPAYKGVRELEFLSDSIAAMMGSLREKTSHLETALELAGRYRLGRVIGQGGMATVYAAVDLENDATIAVKVLHPHLRRQAVVAARFRQEVIAARKVSHPSIVRIFDTSRSYPTALQGSRLTLNRG